MTFRHSGSNLPDFHKARKLRTDRPVPCSDQRIPEHFILC